MIRLRPGQWSSLQAAVDYGIQNGEHIHLDDGTYTISAPLVVDPGNLVPFTLTGSYGAVITTTSAITMLDVPGNAQLLRIDGLFLDGQNTAGTTAVSLAGINSTSVIQNIRAIRVATGFNIDGCQASWFKNLEARELLNNGRGFYINDCNGLLMTRCRSFGTGSATAQDGFVVEGIGNPGAVKFDRCFAETNGASSGSDPNRGNGWRIQNRPGNTSQKPIILSSCWAETNRGHAVYIDADDVVICDGGTFNVPIQAAGTSRAVFIEDGTAVRNGIFISANSVDPTQGIQDDGGGLNYIYDNTNDVNRRVVRSDIELYSAQASALSLNNFLGISTTEYNALGAGRDANTKFVLDP